MPIAAPSAQTTPSVRIESIDLMRGIAILLMIMGHTYDYLSYEAARFMGASSTLPLAMLNVDTTTAPVFFNRWITHIGAPVFLYLAGVGAYLWEHKGARRSLTGFLVPRGLLLIGLQAVRIVAQLLAPTHQSSLDVLWCIGVSMILLAGVARWPRFVLPWGAVVLLAGHGLPAALHLPGHDSSAWRLLAAAHTFEFGGQAQLFNRFPILPWFAMMLLGYATGHLFRLPDAARKRFFLRVALALGATAIVLRAFNVDGFQPGWRFYPDTWQTVASFVNILKYPPSLYFSLATMAQIFFLFFLMDAWNPRSAFVARLGSASLFIYILHIPVCKGLAVAVARMADALGWPVPREALFSLPGVYALATLALAAMYPLIVFYIHLKRTHRHIKVLGYL